MHGSDEKMDVQWARPSSVELLSPNALSRVSELIIFDSHCGVLANKQSLRNIPYRKAQELFAKHMTTIGPKSLNPFFRDDGIDFFYLSKSDVYIVAVHPSPEGDSPLLVVLYMDFLQRVYEVLKDCIGVVNEAYITVNRMLVFEVLDEMVSFGYGLISTYAEVKPHLSLEPIRPKIPQQDELASRFFGINAGEKMRPEIQKDKAPNSAYINIVEGLSAVLGPNGEVRTSELWGKLTLISTLEQPAPINIQLNPDLIVRTSDSEKGQVAGAIHIEHPSFHPCVDTSQLAKKKTLRILPPADQTRLMVYTLSDSACIRIPIILIPTLQPIEGSRDQNLILRLINQAESKATASYVRVKIQFPQTVTGISTTKSGERQTSKYHSTDKMAEWEVKKSPGTSEEMVTFRMASQSDKPLELADIGPIFLAFNMTHFSSSGLMVRMAQVESGRKPSKQPGLPPECFFGVSTKAASYTVRTDSLSS